MLGLSGAQVGAFGMAVILAVLARSMGAGVVGMAVPVHCQAET